MSHKPKPKPNLSHELYSLNIIAETCMKDVLKTTSQISIVKELTKTTSKCQPTACAYVQMKLKVKHYKTEKLKMLFVDINIKEQRLETTPYKN